MPITRSPAVGPTAPMVGKAPGRALMGRMSGAREWMRWKMWAGTHLEIRYQGNRDQEIQEIRGGTHPGIWDQRARAGMQRAIRALEARRAPTSRRGSRAWQQRTAERTKLSASSQRTPLRTGVCKRLAAPQPRRPLPKAGSGSAVHTCRQLMMSAGAPCLAALPPLRRRTWRVAERARYGAWQRGAPCLAALELLRRRTWRATDRARYGAWQQGAPCLAA